MATSAVMAAAWSGCQSQKRKSTMPNVGVGLQCHPSQDGNGRNSSTEQVPCIECALCAASSSPPRALFYPFFLQRPSPSPLASAGADVERLPVVR
eukprot:4952736-Pyramimonas_sp.AAC.1